jgi:alkylation response protein AidB-like acyl-CoA dehydrogenase
MSSGSHRRICEDSIHQPMSTKDSRMDFDLLEGQELFLDTTKRFLAAHWSTHNIRGLLDDPRGIDPSVLSRGVDLGWTSLMVPEHLGGGSVSGEPVLDVAVLAKELGRALFSGPIIPTNIAAYALSTFGSKEIADIHLPAVASGMEVIAWAVAEQGTWWGADATDVRAVPVHGAYQLHGIKSPIQDAQVAHQFLVSAEAPEGLTQFLVPADAEGVAVRPLHSIDLARRFASVQFDAVEVTAASVVGSAGNAGEAIERQLALALALQCAETVGATEFAFDMTLAFVKDRKAFGRAVGSYQAIKHRFADMFLWLESAKAVTAAAVAAVQSGERPSATASLAKAYVAEKCPLIVRDCLQMHGGLGFTWDHDIHLFLRRVESNALTYGWRDYHLDRLAPVIGV